MDQWYRFMNQSDVVPATEDGLGESTEGDKLEFARLQRRSVARLTVRHLYLDVIATARLDGTCDHLTEIGYFISLRYQTSMDNEDRCWHCRQQAFLPLPAVENRNQFYDN